MAIIDSLLEFTPDGGQTLSAEAASEYRIDFGQKAPTTGLDTMHMTAVFTVREDVTGSLQIKLQDCDTETGSYTDCASTVTLESPTAGTVVKIPMPYHHRQFMQAYFGGSPTAGTVHGFITTGFQDNVAPEIAPSIASQY